MNKTFKKIVASLMAVTTLAVSAVGINASATDGTGYVRTSAGTSIGKSSLSVTTTFVYIKTAYNNTNDLCDIVKAEVTSTTGATIYGDRDITKYGASSAALSCPVTGVTKASSYHYIKIDDTVGSGTLTVIR